MLNYGIIFFIIKYLVCLGLFYYIIKTKRTELVFKSVGITFIAFSIIVIINLLLSIFDFIESHAPFYEINFIDFISVVLIINLFLHKMKAREI
jgi:hypothetical protein